MKRSHSFIIIFFIYLFAFFTSLMLYHQLNISSVLYKFIICDIFATIIVWLFSLIFKNSSVY
ncbi:MAG: hypothetical protein PHP65_00995, partial [Bacilli bacterium]|nr:hypothetical protein [Bacilli bacterium]